MPSNVLPISKDIGSTSDRIVRSWFQKFCCADMRLKAGRVRLCIIDSGPLNAIDEQKPRPSVREMSQAIWIDIAKVSRNQQKTGKVKNFGKRLLQELNMNQTIRRFEVSSIFFLRNRNDAFVDWIVICDEIQIVYDKRKQPGQWLVRYKFPQTFPNLKFASVKYYRNCLLAYDLCCPLQLSGS